MNTTAFFLHFLWSGSRQSFYCTDSPFKRNDHLSSGEVIFEVYKSSKPNIKKVYVQWNLHKHVICVLEVLEMS